jgi:serine/threonine-protein kinase
MISSARIRLVARLGGGGMGDVFLAELISGDGPRLVALKRIRASAADDPRSQARFEREVRVSALLRHPNIVSTLEHGADDEGPFLVLEYVEGCSAAKLIAQARTFETHLPLDVALSILADIADGLTFAHEYRDEELGVAGLIHRDLSPDNILIGRDGTARLADFGIALLSGSTGLTGTGALMGKAGYIAPELYEGMKADARSDLFAFGATAFRLLAGTPAFRADTEAGMMRAVMSAAAPNLTALRAEVPPSVAQLVASCLEKSPAARPTSIRAVATGLREALDGLAEHPRAHVARLMAEWVPEIEARSTVPNLDPPHETPAERRTVTGAVSEPGTRQRRTRLVVTVALGLVLLGGVLISLPSTRPVGAYVDDVLHPVVDGEGSADPERNEFGAARLREPQPRLEPVPSPPVRDLEPVPVQLPLPASAPAPSAADAAGAVAEDVAEDVAARLPGVIDDGAPRRLGRAPSATSRAPKSGVLRLRVSPWAEVFLDGRLLGQTPLPEQTLAPGTHSIILVNGELGVRRSYRVNVRAGEQKTFSADLSRR